MNENNLVLRKFNMRKLAKDNIIVMIGRRRSGKSFCVRELLYFMKTIPCGIVISRTEKMNRFYSSIIPDIFIHEEFNREILKNVIKKQEKKCMQYQKKYGMKAYKDKWEKSGYNVFIIMDDMNYDTAWTRENIINEIFMNGRHYNILYILTLQYPVGIPPTLRTQIDYIFLFLENQPQNRKRYYNLYGGVIPTYKMFCNILDICTANYGCLVIDNGSKSLNLEDCIFHYRAKDRGDFKVGSQKFWKVHKRCYNDNYDDNENCSTNGVILKEEVVEDDFR